MVLKPCVYRETLPVKNYCFKTMFFIGIFEEAFKGLKGSLWEFPFCPKKTKHRKIHKTGKNVNIGDSPISVFFPYVLVYFPLVSDAPMMRELCN